MAADTSFGCPLGSDNQLGPQISIYCRPFDFTLLFEDIFFVCLPPASAITVLFVLHLVFTIFQVHTSALNTHASLPSATLNIVATFTAACVSLLEDQRSLRSSDLLTLYFLASSLCSLPRLRSLWIIPSASVGVCRYLWLSIFIVTVLALIVESTPKTKILKPHYQKTPKEQTCGFLNRSFFIWILPFLQRGYSNVIRVEDIEEIDTRLQGQECGEKLQSAWKCLQPNYNCRHQLIKATFYAYRWAFLSAVIPRLALSVFTFAQPFLITATIDYIGSPSTPQSKMTGKALIGAYIVVYVGLAVSKAVYWRQILRLLTMIRSGLISMIYKQTVGMTAAALKDSEAITLMGTDVERIVPNLRNLHETWASILEVGVAIWLLEREVWIACIIPLIISLGSVLAMVPVSTRSGQAQKQWIERVQERLTVTSSMLGKMKTVQMLGLDDILFKMVSRLRQVEVKTSVRFRKLLIWQIALSNVPATFAPCATFTIYAIIAVLKHNGSILSGTAITTLALISILTNPLLIFCQAMPANLQAAACFSRIEKYCMDNSTILLRPSTQASVDTLKEDKEQPFEISKSFDTPLVSFKSAEISWSSRLDPTLRNLNLSVRRGIVMIIGPVGCGKSTLIESMINQSMVTGGTITASFSKAAYCPQSPWIQNDTIRRNIIGTSEFDKEWYDFTALSCGIEQDFKAMPEGDMRMAGSDGDSLSGGQKQTIALARAVYSKLEVVLLDNCFSVLDSNSISVISNHLFSKDGYFRKAGRSVVLATTTYQMLPYADGIIVLDQGEVAAMGSYDEIIIQKPEIALKLQTDGEDSFQHGGPSELSLTSNERNAHIDEIEPTDNKKDDHSRQQGSWSVYGYYFDSAGYTLLLFFLAFATIEAFCTSFQTLWMQWWVEANEEQPNQQLGMYLGVYAMIFGLTLLAIVAGCWLLFVRILNKTSPNLHSDLLRSALGAPVSSFQGIDTGSMINRFSQDLELIDMMLPIYAVNFVMSLLTVLINTIIICALGKYLGASIPLLGLVLYFLQSYYLRTSRQVRLLDIEAKAPLYAHFLETVHGISSIRAFSWDEQFCNKSQFLLNRSQRPMYMLFCIQQWLTLVLDLIVGMIAALLSIIITSLKDQFNSAPIGVALTLLLTLNQTLTQAIKMWTMTETSVGAVTRIQRFIEDTPSSRRNASSPPPDWPSRGAVNFHNVTAGYDLATNPIIKNLTLTIKPGKKIAICGASGSGKTSLLMAMFQMLEIYSGHVTINGQDINKMEQSAIHSTINVISQEPFFLLGTLRFNLDPHQRVSDESLISAVEKVGLWSQISPKGGLDMTFSDSNWSVGQRQLLSLARALVVKAPILVLDEATSSVDWDTESLMQSIIEKELSQQTIIAVIHRFRYIDRFDMVALLRHGELLEVDRPDVLLSRDSEFRKLYQTYN
ncbi:ATP-binding cassette transporter, putative [Talaromyces stipitatus ATCC 10500]|uniref:ATP-binding cassette transporter, putative n=1 Tax=Talaromyces stipitatus (strain ATCC 10500 / CBS 375.48 / QM 6759 / NRRL 1006) TaxID=441959 RepID=B8M398_TALSN|nr:ATP-binding cassette transporter, putative [Talaromyces stipitatus ATCC 10500]EED22270.1 ATP-binding cassette transporter, putative [Talaromyces stipitatus ATCC 10500]